ncbi:MAG: MFS transporter, partial [Streptomyces sp.]|nr:MFS transporter [Streptomyces sp.]
PLLVMAVVATSGLHATPLLLAPALVGAALCAAAVRAAGGRAGTAGGAVGSGRDDWPSFLRLSGAIVCRSVVFVGLSAFVSLYVRQRTGGGDAAGTAALCVLYAGGAFGTVLGGRLAERYGRLTVVRRSYVLTVPAVAGVVLVPGPGVYLFVGLASAGLYVPFSLHVTLGQDYLPRRVGTASGVTLGLTVSVGGLAAPAVGALADATSLQVALAPLIALPLVGRLLLCGLREPGPKAQVVPAGSVSSSTA